MSKSMRLVVVADTHGDKIDPVAESAFFQWLAEYKPQLRIHGGDAWDFRPIRNGASQTEMAESMKQDFDAGMAFLKRLFSGGEVKYFLRGNHDERLWDLAENGTGILRDHAKDMVAIIEAKLKQWGVTMLPYDSRLGVLRLGHLQVIHGFKCGVGAGAAHAKIYRNCIFGHTHSQEIVPVENLDGPSVAMGTGCLAVIDMPYNARQVSKLRHQQGWVTGTLFKDGTYQAFQVKRIGDHFHAPTQFKSY
jgi:predicted phosphodiesterase